MWNKYKLCEQVNWDWSQHANKLSRVMMWSQWSVEACYIMKILNAFTRGPQSNVMLHCDWRYSYFFSFVFWLQLEFVILNLRFSKSECWNTVLWHFKATFHLGQLFCCGFQTCMNHSWLVHDDWKKKINKLSISSKEFKLKWNFSQMNIFLISIIFIIRDRTDWLVCIFKSIKMYKTSCKYKLYLRLPTLLKLLCIAVVSDFRI